MNTNDNLPVLGSLLAAAPVKSPELDLSHLDKLSKDEKKMMAMRLAVAMEKLHFTAHDRGNPEEVGITASRTLAMTMLEHFETIIYALRVAGGARKP